MSNESTYQYYGRVECGDIYNTVWVVPGSDNTLGGALDKAMDYVMGKTTLVLEVTARKGVQIEI